MVWSNGETTSRKANIKLALRCQCLPLLNVILFLNTQKIWQMGSLCCTKTILLNGSLEKLRVSVFTSAILMPASGTKPIYITISPHGPILCRLMWHVMHCNKPRTSKTDATLECGGLTPLWSCSSIIDNKAASGRRTPKWGISAYRGFDVNEDACVG